MPQPFRRWRALLDRLLSSYLPFVDFAFYIQHKRLSSNSIVARTRLCTLEPRTPVYWRFSSIILEGSFLHPRMSYWFSMRIHPAERKPGREITVLLCVYRHSLHQLSSSFPRSTLATNRAEAHSTICPARRFATLRVVVPTLSKAMGVRRLSAHSAYCRPNDSTLLSDRMLRAILQPTFQKESL